MKSHVWNFNVVYSRCVLFIVLGISELTQETNTAASSPLFGVTNNIKWH